MGADAHVVLVGAGSGASERARSEIDRLEHLWSRFLPSSEVSEINESSGRAVRVSPETFALFERAIEGWRATNGLFDPTVLRALEGLGYDRDFATIPKEGPVIVRGPSPGCAGFELDRRSLEIALPIGVGFDPGGIGKGYAADIVATRAVEQGDARGACINLGGDMRMVGEGPEGGPWVIGVEDPFGGSVLASVPIQEGAIATTSSMRRRWQRGDDEHHHIVDPRTGGSAQVDLVAVTVVTGEAWWAEVVAKAAFLAGLDEAIALLKSLEAPGLLAEPHGFIHPIGGMEEWLR